MTGSLNVSLVGCITTDFLIFTTLMTVGLQTVFYKHCTRMSNICSHTALDLSKLEVVFSYGHGTKKQTQIFRDNSFCIPQRN